jgi:cytochrome c-type biogenesis protein CcmH/NrfG
LSVRARSALLVALLALLALLAVLPYLPGLPGEFVYDDHRLIADNEGLRRPFDARRALLRDYYAADVDRMGLGYYRPVAILSNEADWRRGGGAPLTFHLTNMGLHAVCTALVFALARMLAGGAVLPAALAGAFFALHPAHAESVAFVSGRVDPLATLFGLAALGAHLRGRRAALPWPWRAAAGLAWLLALLSKEMAVTVPLIAVLLDLGRGERRGWVGSYVPYALAAALYLPLRLAALGALSTAAPTWVAVSWWRPPVVVGSYLAWIVLPPPGLHLEPEPVTGLLALAAAGLAVATPLAAALLWRRGARLPAALLLAIPLALLPVAQLRPIETALSERFLYLPSALAALLLSVAGAGRRTVLTFGAVGLLLLAYAAILVPRARQWRDAAALWTAYTRAQPGAVKGWLNLGRALAADGDAAGAQQAYRQAHAVAPDLPLEGEMAAFDDAPLPERIARIRATLQRIPHDGALWANLGFLLLEAKDAPGARDAFRQAVTATPHRARAWLGLALADLQLLEIGDADAAAARAAALDPSLGLAAAIRVECALRAGQPCEALRRGEGIVLSAPEEAAALKRLLEVARQGCP